jgi:hypothetical protein
MPSTIAFVSEALLHPTNLLDAHGTKFGAKQRPRGRKQTAT